jgi:hypothetical protein
LACRISASVTDSALVFIADYLGADTNGTSAIAQVSALPGDTNQRFEATVNASYTVIVRDSNCIDSSACFTVNNIGLPEMSAAVFDLYPNPTTRSCTIYLPKVLEKAMLFYLTAKAESFLKPNFTKLKNTASTCQAVRVFIGCNCARLADNIRCGF